MKNLLIIILITGFASANAQEKVTKRTFKIPKGSEIELKLKFGQNIIIEGWDKDELEFEAVVLINGGQLNDLHEIDFKSTDSYLLIESDFKNTRANYSYFSNCRDNEHGYYRDGKGVCMEINYMIKVPRNAGLSIESISGDIEIKGFYGELWAKSISGFIDLSWDTSKGADLSMKTITGELYSDIDLAILNKHKMASIVGYNMRATHKGGGKRIHLETISSDIFLRKN